MNATRKLAA